MYNTVEQTNFIPTQKPVYRGLPVEKLGMPHGGILPLQLGFYGNRKAGLPVTVHFKTASTPEQRIVAFAMPVSNSTAAGTPLGCVIRVKNVKFNQIIEAPSCKRLPEFVEGHPENFLVEIPAFAAESPESFNRDSGVVLLGYGDDLPDDFANPVPDEIRFFVLETQEASLGSAASSVSKRLQPGSPLHDFLTLSPDVFSKVELLPDFSVVGQNGNGEALAVYIHPCHVIHRFGVGFLGEIGYDLQVRGEAIRLACPARGKKRGIALIWPVLPYGNGNPLPGPQTKLDKTSGVGPEIFAVSGNVEFDCHLFDGRTIGLNYVPYNITNDLGIEVGDSLAG